MTWIHFIGVSCTLRYQDIVGYGLSLFCYGCICREKRTKLPGFHSRAVVLKIIVIFRSNLRAETQNAMVLL